ncbi:unnamed protein product [Caenorhabditis nigoni]
MVHRPDLEECASRIRIRTTAGAAQMMQHQRLVSGQRFEVQRSPRKLKEVDRQKTHFFCVHQRGRRVPRSFNNADDVTTQQQRPTAHKAAVDYRTMSARNQRESQAVQDVFSNANSNSGQFGTPK